MPPRNTRITRNEKFGIKKLAGRVFGGSFWTALAERSGNSALLAIQSAAFSKAASRSACHRIQIFPVLKTRPKFLMH
jgi:hypothetical protein